MLTVVSYKACFRRYIRQVMAENSAKALKLTAPKYTQNRTEMNNRLSTLASFRIINSLHADPILSRDLISTSLPSLVRLKSEAYIHHFSQKTTKPRAGWTNETGDFIRSEQQNPSQMKKRHYSEDTRN